MKYNIKIQTIKTLLLEAIANIDAGNSNHSDEELQNIIDELMRINRGIKRISKREACDRILHCSQSTFDKYLAMGLIPKGKKQYGFKELSWAEKDFDEALKYRKNEQL